MIKFACRNCGYQFEALKKDLCPYCGKDSVEKEKNASELIDEVAELLEE